MSERIEAPQKVECTACGYETLCRLYPRGGHMSGEEKWLCKICANTLVGTAIDYRHYGDQLATMKTVAYVGNAILDALRALRPSDGGEEQP